MLIGICDDDKDACEVLKKICITYEKEFHIEFYYKIFTSGEEVLEYCNNNDNQRIDLLFLDIEMGEINGIAVKNLLMKNQQVWRIVFVSSYDRLMGEAFGLKTIGFVKKTAEADKINKLLNLVVSELKTEVVIDLTNEGVNKVIKLEDIAYIEAQNNNVMFVLYNQSVLEKIEIRKNLKYWEARLREYSMVRVHKAFLVNMQNISRFASEIIYLRDTNITIPVGRTYGEQAKKFYRNFVKQKMEDRN